MIIAYVSTFFSRLVHYLSEGIANRDAKIFLLKWFFFEVEQTVHIIICFCTVGDLFRLSHEYNFEFVEYFVRTSLLSKVL